MDTVPIPDPDVEALVDLMIEADKTADSPTVFTLWQHYAEFILSAGYRKPPTNALFDYSMGKQGTLEDCCEPTPIPEHDEVQCPAGLTVCPDCEKDEARKAKLEADAMAAEA